MANVGHFGFDPERLARVGGAISTDIQLERYDGAEIMVGRGGNVVLHEQFGWADRAGGRRIAKDQPFITMSAGKQFVSVLVLNRIERGDFSANTPVADLIPEFGAHGKKRITIAQVLTHTAGLTAMMPAIPPEAADKLDAMVMAACSALPECMPGKRVSYSAIVAFAVLAEVLRRAEGCRRSFTQLLDEDLFKPLRMLNSSLGVPAKVKEHLAPVVARDRRLGMFDPAMLEMLGNLLNADSEVPAGGYVSTVPDMFRFAEMLRRGGELDGVRILSPATVELVQKNQTGDFPNSLFDYTYEFRGWEPFPAYLGLGFMLRGEGVHPAPFGLLASPRTFGGLGAGSNVFWIDPVRDLSYVFFSSGLMEDSYSIERHQRLSDLVLAALVA